MSIEQGGMFTEHDGMSTEQARMFTEQGGMFTEQGGISRIPANFGQFARFAAPAAWQTIFGLRGDCRFQPDPLN